MNRTQKIYIYIAPITLLQKFQKMYKRSDHIYIYNNDISTIYSSIFFPLVLRYAASYLHVGFRQTLESSHNTAY